MLCDGLRVIDVDFDDRTITGRVEAMLDVRFGPSPLRTRSNSGRFTAVYRAAEGTPGKRVLTMDKIEPGKTKPDKIEALGRGNQFVAYGLHPSGVPLEWNGLALEDVGLTGLVAVTEDQITAFFDAVQEITGPGKATGSARVLPPADAPIDMARVQPPSDIAVVDLLKRMPNTFEMGWDEWISILLAVSGCAAADGDENGLIREAAIEYSDKHESGCTIDNARKWDEDISKRPPKFGWEKLQDYACQYIPGYRAEMVAADFDVPLSPEPERPGRTLFRSRDYLHNPGRPYVVKGLIAPRSVALLLGSPAAGKSTCATYAAFCVASGMPLFGRRTQACKVIYAAAEDLFGVQARVGAFGICYGDADDLVVTESGNLSHPTDRDDLVKFVEEFGAGLLIIDTLNAAFPGIDENDSAGMGSVTSFCRRVANTGCSVLVVHHPAKNSDGSPRGHSSLNGMLDTVITLTPDDIHDKDALVRGTLQKNRSGGTDYRFAFRKDIVTLGIDDDGDPTTTTLPIEADLRDEAAVKAQQLTPREQQVLDVFATAAPDGQGITQTAWREACVEHGLFSNANSSKSQNAMANKAIGTLADKRKVELGEGGLLYAVHEPARPNGRRTQLDQYSADEFATDAPPAPSQTSDAEEMERLMK